jgi:4-hydroxybenzoate polyprenyltransferase
MNLKLFATVSRLHIVAIAALGTFTFAWLFSGRYRFDLAALSALDWFLVNLLNRVVDLEEDAHNQIAGTDFVARNRRALLVGGFALLGASVIASAIVWPRVTPLRVAFHALGLAYNWPLLPGRKRIKQLYFWKNTASAIGFLLTVFGYALADGGAPRMPPAGVILTIAFFFAFELSYEIIYDLRDAPGDAAAGVRTYPVVHGTRGAVRIIDGLCAASMAALAAGFFAHLLPWRVFIMVAAPAIQLVLYKRALRRGISSRDCIQITWTGVALLSAYHLWVVAGLPGV